MPRLRNLYSIAASMTDTAMNTLNFKLSKQAAFGPRLGSVLIRREDGYNSSPIKTPGLITTTSRGVIPHLSGDHVSLTEAVRWVELPFESLYVF